MCMQRVAFALPLTLATPVTIGIYIALCHGNLDRIDFIKDMMYWECSESFSNGNLRWQLVVGLGLWWYVFRIHIIHLTVFLLTFN